MERIKAVTYFSLPEREEPPTEGLVWELSSLTVVKEPPWGFGHSNASVIGPPPTPLFPRNRYLQSIQCLHSDSHQACWGPGKLPGHTFLCATKKGVKVSIRKLMLWKNPQRVFRFGEYPFHLLIWNIIADIFSIPYGGNTPSVAFLHKISMMIAEKKEVTAFAFSTKSELPPHFFQGCRFFFG